jgi:hypothetical protein
MRRGLGAWSQVDGRHQLGQRIDGQPDPQDLRALPQAGADLIDLEVRQMQVA